LSQDVSCSRGEKTRKAVAMHRLGEFLGKIVAGFIAIVVLLVIVGIIVSATDGGDDGGPDEGGAVVRQTPPPTGLPDASPDPTRTPAPTRTPRPTPAPMYDLALISASCTRMADIGFIECEGFVQNLKADPIRNVEAVIILYDSARTPISSDSALIDYEPLLPGQQSPYTVILRYNPAFDAWRVEFKEFLGGSLSVRDDRPR